MAERVDWGGFGARFAPTSVTAAKTDRTTSDSGRGALVTDTTKNSGAIAGAAPKNGRTTLGASRVACLPRRRT